MGLLQSVFGNWNDNLDGAQAMKLINENGNMIIIDVRAKHEFERGAIVRAINVPIEELIKKLPELEKYKKRKILVYCGMGTKSKGAMLILRRSGFEHVYNLKEGMDTYMKKN